MASIPISPEEVITEMEEGVQLNLMCAASGKRSI